MLTQDAAVANGFHGSSTHLGTLKALIRQCSAICWILLSSNLREGMHVILFGVIEVGWMPCSSSDMQHRLDKHPPILRYEFASL